MIGIVIPNMPKDEEICTKAMGQRALGNVSINCEEQSRDDCLVYQVSFRHMTRTVSEEYGNSPRLRDKPWTEVLVTQSWRSFPSHQQTTFCVTGS